MHTSMKRRLLGGCLAALAVLGTAACGGSEVPNTTNPSTMTAILQRRAEAVQQGNQQLFLQDVDTRNRGLVARERMVFHNLRQFQFTLFQYQLEHPTLFGYPLKAGDHHNPTGMDVDAWPVANVYQIAGVDQSPGAATYWVDLGQVGGAWRIVGVTQAFGGQPLGVQQDVPWDLAPLMVVHGGDVILAADSTVPNLDGYARTAAAASGAVRKLWGSHPAPAGFLLFLTNDARSFHDWFAPKRDVSTYDGLTIPLFAVNTAARSLIPQQPLRYGGSRITVDLSSSLDRGWGTEQVMRHELTHAIGLQGAKPTITMGSSLYGGVPAWAEEGFARWVQILDSPASRRGVASELGAAVHDGAFTGQPPGDATFYSGSPEQVELHYAIGESVFGFIAYRWGPQKAVGLYAAYASTGEVSTGGAGFGIEFFTALNKVGIGDATFDDIPAFTDAWTAYVRSL